MSTKQYSPYGIAHPQKSFENGRAGTTTLDMHTGDLMHIHTDVALDGIKMPLNVAHVYHASDRQSDIASGDLAPYGRGWRITPVETLTVSPGSSPYAVYCDGTGMEYNFYASSISTGTVITDDLGLGLTLKENVTGYLDLTDKQGNLKRFERVVDPTGIATNVYRIKLIKNTNGVTWGYSYTANGMLNAVTDGCGRSASMFYGSSSGLLVQMRYRPTPGAEKLIINFGYSADHDLTSITYPDGSVTQFAYLEDGTPPNVHDLFATVNPETGLRQEYSKVGGTGSNAISWFNHVQSFMPTRYEENGAEPSASPEMKGGEHVNLTKSESICTVGVPGKAHEIYKVDEQGRTVLTYTNLSYNRKADDALLDLRTPATVYEYASSTNPNTGLPNKDARVVLQASTGPEAHKLVNGKTVEDNPNLIADPLFTVPWEEDNEACKWGYPDSPAVAFKTLTNPIFVGVKLEEQGEVEINRSWADPSTSETRVSQTVDLSERELTENCLVVSLWANVKQNVDEAGSCKLTATLRYEDGNGTVSRSFVYDGNTNHWQLGVIAIPLDATRRPEALDVCFALGGTNSRVSFTGAMLTNEPATRITYADNTYYSVSTCGTNVTVRSKVTRTDGHSTQVEEYDVYGNCIRITETDPSGNSWTSEALYNSKQNVIRTKDYRGMITEYGYSTEGAQTSVKSYPYDSEGGTPTDFTYVSYVYDATRDCYKKAYGEDGIAIAEITEFDANGNPRVVTSKGITAECSYDVMGRLLQYCVPDAENPIRTVTHTYTNGKQTKVTVNNELYYETRKKLPSEVLTSDLVSRLKETKNYEKEVVYIGTNADNEKAYAPAMHWEFEADASSSRIEPESRTYDSYGRLTERVDNIKLVRYNYYYNRRSQLIAVMAYTTPEEEFVSAETYTYDASGRLLSCYNSITGKTHEYVYERDANNKPYPDAKAIKVTDNTYTATVTRDGFGRMTGSTVKHGSITRVTNTVGYATGTAGLAVGAQTSRPNEYVCEVGSESYTYSYTYNENGNILSVARQRNNTEEEILARYKYDGFGRLIREDNLEYDRTYSYTYDSYGNCATASWAYYTSENEAVTPEGTNFFSYAVGGCHRLSWTNGMEFLYDDMGNTTLYYDTPLTWAGRFLMKYGTDNTSYEYNASGVRTKKTTKKRINNDHTVDYVITYTVDGTRILKEEHTQENAVVKTIVYNYGADGSLIGFIYNGAYYYYGKNLFGDIVDIYDALGINIAHYAYTAWGHCEVRDANDAVNTDADFIGNINPFRYRGYYYDAESGFYNVNGRYYAPGIGRFINAELPENLGADGELHGYNQYAYCGNNPITKAVSYGGTPFVCHTRPVSNWTVSTHQWSGGTNTISYCAWSAKNGPLSAGILKASASGLRFSFGWDKRVDKKDPRSFIFEILSVSVSLFSAEWSPTDDIAFAIDIGTLNVYAGADFTKDWRFGVDATVYAASASVDFGIVSIGGYLGGFGWTSKYEDGKLKFGLIAFLGVSVSIDLQWILELFILDIS